MPTKPPALINNIEDLRGSMRILAPQDLSISWKSRVPFKIVTSIKSFIFYILDCSSRKNGKHPGEGQKSQIKVLCKVQWAELGKWAKNIDTCYTVTQFNPIT